MIDDRERDLGTVLSYLVGRQLHTVELAKALGMSRSGYYAARDKEKLVTSDNLLRFAAVFGLNPVDLLVRFGLLSSEAVDDYTAARTVTSAPGRGKRRLQPRLDMPPL